MISASDWVSFDENSEGMTSTRTLSGPERIGGHAGRERGVDSSAHAQHDFFEAVLVDVVPRAQH